MEAVWPILALAAVIACCGLPLLLISVVAAERRTDSSRRPAAVDEAMPRDISASELARGPNGNAGERGESEVAKLEGLQQVHRQCVGALLSAS